MRWRSSRCRRLRRGLVDCASAGRSGRRAGRRARSSMACTTSITPPPSSITTSCSCRCGRSPATPSMPDCGAAASRIGSCSGSRSAWRCGRNISWWCWRRRWLCSCSSTAMRARRCHVRPLGRDRGRARGDGAAPPLARAKRFSPLCLCQRACRARARPDRPRPASAGVRARPIGLSAAGAADRRRAGVAAAQIKAPVAANADAFDRRIVTLLAFGPAATTVALSALTGRGTIAMWGYPLWLFLGLWIVLDARNAIEPVAPRPHRGAMGHRVRAVRDRLRRQLFAASRSTTVIARCSIPAIGSPTNSPAAFVPPPASRWSTSSAPCGMAARRPLRARAAAGADRRRPRRAPWIDLGDLRSKGAVVVWTGGDPAVIPVALRGIAGDAQVQPPFTLPFRRGGHILTVGWAILRPLPAFARAGKTRFGRVGKAKRAHASFDGLCSIAWARRPRWRRCGSIAIRAFAHPRRHAAAAPLRHGFDHARDPRRRSPRSRARSRSAGF